MERSGMEWKEVERLHPGGMGAGCPHINNIRDQRIQLNLDTSGLPCRSLSWFITPVGTPYGINQLARCKGIDWNRKCRRTG